MGRIEDSPSSFDRDKYLTDRLNDAKTKPEVYEALHDYSDEYGTGIDFAKRVGKAGMSMFKKH